MALLETKNVTKAYGALLAVSNVSFLINPGKIHSIIGPNGAGKTTFFNLLAGVYSPTSGDIVFEGKNISAMKVYKRAQIGIGRSYQVTSIFPELTVRENIRVAVQAGGNHNFSLFRAAENLSEYMDKTNAILEEMGLISLADQIASTIPYGSQRSSAKGWSLPRVLRMKSRKTKMSKTPIWVEERFERPNSGNAECRGHSNILRKESYSPRNLA